MTEFNCRLCSATCCLISIFSGKNREYRDIIRKLAYEILNVEVSWHVIVESIFTSLLASGRKNSVTQKKDELKVIIRGNKVKRDCPKCRQNGFQSFSAQFDFLYSLSTTFILVFFILKFNIFEILQKIIFYFFFFTTIIQFL